jgi:PAS domain S-box-containing protein
MTEHMLDIDAPFRLAVQGILDYAILMLDTEGHILSWNTGAELIKQYRADEILGQHFSIFYPPEEVARGKPATELAGAIASGRFEDEGWRLRKDGSRFWANVIVTPLRDASGEVSGFVKLTRDLTGRREAEVATKRSNETYRHIVEAAPNAMVMIDQSGLIVMVNAQTEHVFGYDRSETLGKPIEMLVPARYRIVHPVLRKNFFIAPQSRPMGEGRDLHGLRKDGSEFPVEIGLNPIETEEGTLVLSSIIDISPRKRLEERFRRVVEAAPSAMVMISRSGMIEMVNNQAERVFGYSRSEMLGQPVEMLVPGRFRHGHPGLRSAFFADPQSRPMGAGRDLYALRKDGSEFPVEIGLNPIETEEGSMILSAIVDISDRKQKEDRIQAALEEKNILLAEIHHRVKNNLQIVHSLLDLHSNRLTDQVAIDMLRESKNRVSSMALIHQVLYQSKDFAAVDFCTVLESLVPTLVQSYRVSPATVDVEIDADKISLPLNAAIPCGLIVNELIANALKHAFPECRCGRIRIRLKPEEPARVMLAVEDDGIGIAPTIDLDQMDTLGLQLVHLLTSQIGGTIEIERADPTRFTIRFPLRRDLGPVSRAIP